VTLAAETTTHAASLFGLSGKIALIVGGYGAIGETISRSLAELGAAVVVAGHNGDKAAALAADLNGQGLRASAHAVDAGNVADIRDAMGRIVVQAGTIDIFVNCLGRQREQLLLDVTEVALDELYTVHLKAAMFLSQEVARHQQAAGRGGKHIHLLSLRSFAGVRDRGYAAFCSMKGAVAMLVRQLSGELGRHRIAVNAVAPGHVHTRKNDKDFADPAKVAKMVERIPLQRVCEPIDVAMAVAFLSAPASDFITGQILVVDGGQTAGH